MSRPFMQNGVDPLQEMRTIDNVAPDILEEMERGVQRPSEPGGGTVGVKVHAAVSSSASGVRPLTRVASRALTVAADAPALLVDYPLVSVSVSLLTPAAMQLPPAPTTRILLNSLTQEPVPLPLPISVDDACQLLNVTPGSPWESIEQARRSLVMQAHPSNVVTLSPNKRARALAEAAQVNAAYFKLFTLRQGLGRG